MPVRPRPANPEDLSEVLRLLTAADLTLTGVADHIDDFLVIEETGQLVAAIGCEDYGQYGLLRSAVVGPAARGRGLGKLLTEQVLERARREGKQAIYLLTMTAESYFSRFGFRRTTRERVPIEVRQSAEFRGACPESAVAMVLEVRSKA